MEVVRTTDFDEAARAGVDLGAVAAQIEAINDQLGPHVVDDVRMQAHLRSEHWIRTPGTLPELSGLVPEEFFPYSPVIGPLNPIAPSFVFAMDGERLRGRGRFSTVHNGPPEGVHGGHVAALMDEVLGVTGVATGNGGFTGTLTIRYEALTPLHTDLEVEGWVDRVEGRKAFIQGEVRNGDTRCAFAEGIFIKSRAQADAGN